MLAASPSPPSSTLGDLNRTMLTYGQTYATANTTTKQLQRMSPEQRRRHNRNQSQ